MLGLSFASKVPQAEKISISAEMDRVSFIKWEEQGNHRAEFLMALSEYFPRFLWIVL